MANLVTKIEMAGGRKGRDLMFCNVVQERKRKRGLVENERERERRNRSEGVSTRFGEGECEGIRGEREKGVEE